VTDPHQVPPKPDEALAAILTAIEAAKADNLDPLLVFDLDGTLYDNAARTLRILLEFAHQHGHELPEVLTTVQKMGPADIVYGVGRTLRAQGLDDDAVIKRIERFWFERFFTNEYLHFDLPTRGAVEFVRRIYEAGGIPAYLTGRDAPNMLLGTIATLQRDGFPVGTVDTRNILKPDFETADHVYKASVVDHLQKSGRVVAVFDNEPGLCNLFKRAFPAATVFRLDMPCAPEPEPLDPGVGLIPHFATLL
jgi:beta-phosphoglucomutase-like phosphatase (HAD superfamily)